MQLTYDWGAISDLESGGQSLFILILFGITPSITLFALTSDLQR
jgi:hypothetical protein